MTEQFANNASSTLNGAIDNVTTSIVITDGSPFPSVGNFRLFIGISPLTAEIVLVTARSGNTLTVVRSQEGTTAQSWPDLTTVTHIVTAGAVEALRANLRRDKPLHSSLDTISAAQDGYALTWVDGDGYWAARPGSQWTTASATEIYTTKTVSIDGYGTLASAHGDGYSKLYVNGKILANSFEAGEIPLTTQGFGYVSDALQTFTVPDGVTSLQVKMWGPGGGAGSYNAAGGGGAGGYSTGYLTVTPGEVLYLAIGSGGKKPVSSSGNGGLGGWPGGGFGTRGDASGAGGGGLTGIFNTSMTQANALMIAGGGGGSTGYAGNGGGGGGGTTGNAGGGGSSGKGGTQSAGGLNGNNTSSPAYTVGSALAGGTAYSDNTTSQGNDDGGGGSGYWGGGAGQNDGQPGGGGSGYLHPSRITSGTMTTGTNGNAGSTSTLPPNSSDTTYIAGVGVGAATGGVGVGNNGGDGYVVFLWGGITSLDLNSIDFANGSSISVTDNNLLVTSATGGNIVLSSGSGTITLQSASDLILSSGTSDMKFNINSAQKYKIYSSGAVVIGDATNNDTSSEAQAGITGPIINISSSTGTISTVTNQATIFNQSGALYLQGNTEVRFATSTSTKGYFDINGIFRAGPSSSSSATLQGATWPITGTDYFWMYNSSGSSWAEIVAGGSTNRSAIQILNNATSNTCGISLFGAGTGHGTVEYAGNGIIEQSGNSTSALIFTKRNGTDGLSFASTGAIWQSGAWTIGRAANNDTSAEAQAGLTGPLLNLTQITGGTLTSTTNQALLYNNAGALTLQGHAGHTLIANTTTVASTSTSKFITNVGRRILTNVKTANYTVTTSDEVIIIGTLSTSITITLPSSPTAGDIYTVKDQAGGAAVNNIIVAGNGNNIDGVPSYTMNTNYESLTVVFANGSWSII